MTYTYTIEGMTCGNCKASVTEALASIDGVGEVIVDLELKQAAITMKYHISDSIFRDSLPAKYSFKAKDVVMPTSDFEDVVEKSKLQQLKPLFIIVGYISATSILLHYKTWNVQEMMIDFMGLFFIVFSFFKMLDVQGFATSFSMYDPVAKSLPFYGKIYPFIETVLGVMLLMRYNVHIALIITILILLMTTYGVTKTLLVKQSIKCACLGTALDLPMTEATFIENALMILMSAVMLFIM
jgi:copper chaperone CopZ